MDDKTFNEMIEIAKNRLNQLRTDVIDGKITSDEYYTMVEQFGEELYKKYPAIDEKLSDEQNEKFENLAEFYLSDEMIESARKNGTLHELIKISDESNEDLLNKHKIPIIDIIQSKIDLSKEDMSSEIYTFENLCNFLGNQNITLNENEKHYISKLLDNPSLYNKFKSVIIDEGYYYEQEHNNLFLKNNFDFILEQIDRIAPNSEFDFDWIIDENNKVAFQVHIDKLPILFKHLKYKDCEKIAKYLIDNDINYIFSIPIKSLYVYEQKEILQYAVSKGLLLTENVVKKLDKRYFEEHDKRSLELINLAIDTDANNILLLKPMSELVSYNENGDLILKEKSSFKIMSEYFRNTPMRKLAIDADYNNIFDIPVNDEMLKYAISKGFKLTRENCEKLSEDYFKNLENARLAIDTDLDNIFNIPANDEMLKYAISKGFKLTRENCEKLSEDYFEYPEFTKIVIETFNYNYDDLICHYNSSLLKYTLYYLQDKNVTSSSNNIDELINKGLDKSKDFLTKYNGAMNFYQGNTKELFLNEEYFRYFLSFNNVNVDDFIQYCFGDSYHFMKGMLKYNTSEGIRSFKKFLDYYRKQINIKDTNSVSELNAFMNCLKGYDHYKEFCDSLIASNTKLTEDNLYEINALFNYNSLLDESLRPKSIDDLTNFSRKIFDSNIEQFFTYDDINMKKNMFCRTILNADLGKINGWLQTYGDTLYLTQLQFENKNDIYLCRYIEEMKRYTTLFEFVLSLDDELTMNNIMNEIANDETKKETVLKWSKYLSNYEERINKMYAKETLRNLTDINNITDSCLDDLLDKESTSKNEVNVYDFSNKNYGLLAHVRSNGENIDNLATGKSSINQSFICLSAVSYINQRYYGINPSDIIFGYNYLPEENFIMSSTSNMSSNRSIQRYSSKVADTSRSQRGFKDTSRAPKGYNSEFLCYREGLKPSCIILPDGREPTVEEIEVAKKYNLYFVKTQKNNKVMVNAPEKIEYKDDYLKDEYNMTAPDISEFKKIMGVRENKRKICIFTDSHGLFEPTAAILEDARKNGATEFYSLGDNVGTGSNPEDVLDLLDIYGVKSVKGNHEMYVIDGVEGFKGHLSEGQVREAKEDSDWTRNKLSKEQIEKIKGYPDSLVIEVAGKKMLLCHHLEDYNTRERLYNPDDYEAVFQGHEHFEKNNSNIYIVRGAGIGYSSDSDELGKAKYIEITEKGNGEYSICVKEVPFYVENTKRDLIEEDGPGRDKMTRWLR